ncbi:MAG: beta-galactosidase, partial [Flavobacterium sp.]|nr:beta-galactosidase [Flavobacterium sp.]
MTHKKFYALLSALLFVAFSLSAQNNYHIDITKVRTDVTRGHLDLGGKNPAGEEISVNSFYLEKNGKPFIPVIGEFHFSRYPHQYWDEELKKMKAGGITVVATYVFWNMHEFKEGKFDWAGDLDVRRFTELCAQNGLEVLMRVGPFAHGEIRNGGLPDWLYGRPIDVRSNDPAYLFYTNRLYQEIGQQLKGLMFKDGGPIIGVQLENEYQHSTAPWGFTYQDAPKERTVAGRDKKIIQDGVGINNLGNEFADEGRDHMKTLKKLALKAGLVAPIYTATGWGFATIVEKGSIPVMAGYAYPFWESSIRPSPFYLFKDIHQKPDYSPVSYDVNLYPSLAAELGTGMAVTYSRRPKVKGESFLPLMVRTVGSGTNGLGFYMYHGGTTPSIG